MLHAPEVLLLDEPWSHLDPEADALVGPLIGRGGSPATRLIVTHDVDRGLSEADQVLALQAGRVALSARATDLTTRPTLETGLRSALS